ncbi:MAG: transcription termination/antitermination protein NusA, partial [Christensenellaceae bacterium]|nr:transcription termination/antitermination protein NusA [Christensenellaceae bacterium]
MRTARNSKIDRERKAQIVDAIRAISHEKGIDELEMLATIERALEAAYRKNTGEEKTPKNYKARIDQKTGEIQIVAYKIVAEEVEDSVNQISLENAIKLKKYYLPGDIIEVDVTPASFLRTAAQTAKQVITQKLRETENGRIAQEYTEKENDILTAVVLGEDA